MSPTNEPVKKPNPKIKDYHEGIPYHLVPKGSKAGCYQLHTPYDCRLKFPLTKKLIHKCERPAVEVARIQQHGLGLRNLVIPRKGPNYYPAVMHKSEYERLKMQAKIVTQEEILAGMHAQEAAIQKAAKESEARKQLLKEKLKQQPGAEAASGTADPELEGPDQAGHTITRAEMLKADQMVGPRLCNAIILASKCHAIRDAQINEKQLIKKELDEEEKRLDAIMEENRQSAVKRAETEEERRHQLRLENLAALKEQIFAHETAKIMEAERIEEESIRVNQGNIAMQIDEAMKLKEKHARQAKLKEMLDQGNAELMYFKQLQQEEERIMNLRIDNFIKAKYERDMKNLAEAMSVKAAKQKGIDHIAKAQKAEKDLKEELERIRNLKIQEDVEREYRRKERDAAIKKNRDLKDLHKARVAQINDIHRMIAREIAKDEQMFNNAARQNEEFLRKEKELENKRKARVEKHRQEIMKQINDKERTRQEIRDRVHNEGVAIRMEQEQSDKYEEKIIKAKVATMRQQKIPEKYVKEVEQTLHKHGYK
ncbi:cilia- and flagella-associated protein 45-like [Hyposmocoma kahamanoa]|uniref:cilia- and flagella-associated protein 45-like n=1 Tax=Hyposmocoma kahamanoa TaxID=1477025 RepID=UPI000E6D5BF3|nr:cilia- and flagella-associated protein 45-like [Hyposmocoma kahamanoa]